MIFIDLTAFRCPLALVKVKLALKALNEGESLSVSLSDIGSKQDVPQFLNKIGHPFSITSDDEGILIIKISKLP